MGIHPAASYLVAPRLREICLPETREQGSYDHHGAPEGRAFADEVLALDIGCVDIVGLESVFPFLQPGDFHAHPFEHEDEVPDIKDFRDIGNGHFLVCEENGTDHFKRLVLGALRTDCPAELVTAFDYKRTHILNELIFLSV